MKAWEVEVFLGSGADTDSIGTYLVWAIGEGDAENVAVESSRDSLNAKANLIRNPGAVDEIDYDGVLMSPEAYAVAIREDGSLRMELDEDVYDLSNPKHPRHHDVYSDATDARD